MCYIFLDINVYRRSTYLEIVPFGYDTSIEWYPVWLENKMQHLTKALKKNNIMYMLKSFDANYQPTTNFKLSRKQLFLATNWKILVANGYQ